MGFWAFGLLGFWAFGLLVACGGGGSSSSDNTPRVADGRLVGVEVEGLAYSSGDQTGTTDSEGTFSYEVGEEVTFSVGGVEIGSAEGAETISPVDLTGSDSAATETQNIVRFLLMLDTDNDSSNGVTISVAVQGMAVNWEQVDFTSSDLMAALMGIISDVASVDVRTPVLPSAMDAQAHLEGTLACLASGVFQGTFRGDTDGRFLLLIQHERYAPTQFTTPPTRVRVGVTSALILNTDENVVSGVVPQQGLMFNSDQSFISGSTTTGAEFSGEIDNYTTLNGSWTDSFGESGTFAGRRIGGSEDAVYRLSGDFNLPNVAFSEANSGMVALDIMEDNSVTGVMATLRGNTITLTGTLTTVTAMIPSGTITRSISVTGGGNTFTLSFDPDGTDTTNDAMLGTTSGFTGSMVNAAGTHDVLGTSCQP